MADTLPLGWNEPAPASSAELLEVLRNVAALVEAGESPEGFINWLLPGPDPCMHCSGTGTEPGTVTIPPGHGSGFNSLDPDPEDRGSYVPCTAGCKQGAVYRPAELEGAEFALMARFRVGGFGPGSGGLQTFQKERTSGEGPAADRYSAVAEAAAEAVRQTLRNSIHTHEEAAEAARQAVLAALAVRT